MTREELLALVNKELGSIKLTLNERAINEELDDSLGDFGDDETANAKLVTRIANRLKRMDGSVHSAVSHEVEEYKKNFKPKVQPKPAQTEGEDPENSENIQFKSEFEHMKAEWSELKEALQKEKADRDRKDLLTSVRKGLEDKFRSSGLRLNSYFVNAAMSKLEVPEKDADVKALVNEAERLYTSETKSAGIDFGKPAGGGADSVAPQKDDGHEFDDVAKRINPSRDSKS